MRLSEMVRSVLRPLVSPTLSKLATVAGYVVHTSDSGGRTNIDILDGCVLVEVKPYLAGFSFGDSRPDMSVVVNKKRLLSRKTEVVHDIVSGPCKNTEWHVGPIDVQLATLNSAATASLQVPEVGRFDISILDTSDAVAGRSLVSPTVEWRLGDLCLRYTSAEDNRRAYEARRGGPSVVGSKLRRVS